MATSKTLRSLNSFFKGFLLFSRIGLLLSPFGHFFKFLGNFINLAKWINRHHKNVEFTDFYTAKKKYDKRLELYTYVSDKYKLHSDRIQYYEFGVANASSFRWWLDKNKNEQSVFYGFDTFEGLPEDWHFYKKGDMSYELPNLNDNRAHFFKGLFQDTFFDFLKSYPPDTSFRKVIHMDADLYSSTLFVLTTFAQYLQEGDIILFDEFNVPNHEFAAWQDFISGYYIKYDVIGAVNNYYQTAFIVKK